ncbi:MAG: AsmA-like C-terminal region-containing protein [Planctomycetota bacterium]
MGSANGTARGGRWRRSIARSARALGWCAFVLLLAGAALDRTAFLDRAVKSVLRARLGALAGDLSLVDAEIEWLDRTLVLRGLCLDLGRQEVFADTLRVRLGWKRGGIAVERAEWLGGEVVLSSALLTALQGRSEGAAAQERGPLELPSLFVRDLDIALETPNYGDVALGRCAFALQEDGTGAPRLNGRFVPSFERRRDGSGEIWITGVMTPDGALEAQGTARALRIVADELPPGEVFDTIRACAPEFIAEFEGRGRLEPGESVLPELDLRLHIADGSIRLPYLPNAEQRPLRDLALSAEARVRPTGPESLWSPKAWQLVVAANGLWEDTRLDVAARWGLGGGEDTLCEAYAFAQDLELGETLLELGGRMRDLVENHEMLAPDGRADVLATAKLPRDWTQMSDMTRAEITVAAVPRGGASLAYHGATSRRGARDEGFPLRVHDLRGLVTWSYRPSDESPIQLGLYGLEGEHAGGAVRVVGSIHETPGQFIGDTPEVRRDRRTYFPAHFHLRIESDGLPVDRDLEEAFHGLRGVQPVGEIFDTYAPNGGTLSFGLELLRVPGRTDLATDLAIELHDVGFAWRDLPLPLESVDGLLLVRTDGGGPATGRGLVSIEARGASPATHGPVTVRGRAQHENHAGIHESLVTFRVDATRVNVRDEVLRRVLEEKQPTVRAILDEVGVAGFMDLSVTTSERPRGEALETWIQATTIGGGLELLPQSFSTPTRDARGRVNVTTTTPSRPAAPLDATGQAGSDGANGQGDAGDPAGAVDSLQRADVSGRAVVQGAWDDQRVPVPVIADVRFTEGSPPSLRVAGAGLDIENQVILGSIVELSRRMGGGNDPLDLQAVDIDGRFDFQAQFELPTEPGAPSGPSDIAFEARLDRFALTGGPTLSDVAGKVRYVDATREWVSDRIWGQLGTTPVSLSHLRFSPERSRFSAELAAEDLPLDREHLRYFVDAATLDGLVEDLGLRGTVDIQNSSVTWVNGDDKVGALTFNGQLGVDDMGLILGIPLELHSVEGITLNLVREGEQLRAHASVLGLEGLLAGRHIDEASVEVSYIAPRLSLSALDGRFEGGRIATLGAEGSQFFSMDLAPPFPFTLGARLSDVDVGQFLRGTFNSDFANEGRMDLDLALEGDTEQLTGIHGAGRVAVDQTRLWAIPLFQALFASLGFPTTAVFRKIEADFRIDSGVLIIDRTRADSDLLSVVGSGSIDFEGGLSTDLEVRFALIDRLGPFTRLLYKIQNSLLRVAVRGTMERPVVVLRGLFSQFFKPADARDRLPLPGFSELPARF